MPRTPKDVEGRRWESLPNDQKFTGHGIYVTKMAGSPRRVAATLEAIAKHALRAIPLISRLLMDHPSRGSSFHF